MVIFGLSMFVRKFMWKSFVGEFVGSMCGVNGEVLFGWIVCYVSYKR